MLRSQRNYLATGRHVERMLQQYTRLQDCVEPIGSLIHVLDTMCWSSRYHKPMLSCTRRAEIVLEFLFEENRICAETQTSGFCVRFQSQVSTLWCLRSQTSYWQTIILVSVISGERRYPTNLVPSAMTTTRFTAYILLSPQTPLLTIREQSFPIAHLTMTLASIIASTAWVQGWSNLSKASDCL